MGEEDEVIGHEAVGVLKLQHVHACFGDYIDFDGDVLIEVGGEALGGGSEGEGPAGASAVYNDERVCCDMAAADFHGRGSAADGREDLYALNVNWTLDHISNPQ